MNYEDEYRPNRVIDDEFVDDGMTAEPCPDCGAMKQWRGGKWATFLGCSAFPKCRWTSYRKSELVRPQDIDSIPGAQG